MAASRLRTLTTWLAALALSLQALIPLGPAISLPGTAEPIVICSALGFKTIYVTFEPEQPAEQVPSHAEESCPVCLSMTAVGLHPPAEGSALRYGTPAGPDDAANCAFQPHPMHLLMGIFARPPPSA
ncbi:hypothetical protein [Pelagibius sp.]|uniref:hypothetical protein n=1 Tax=Pelagibius sp. TaxID=1931238 RepID=UPI003B51088F